MSLFQTTSNTSNERTTPRGHSPLNSTRIASNLLISTNGARLVVKQRRDLGLLHEICMRACPTEET